MLAAIAFASLDSLDGSQIGKDSALEMAKSKAQEELVARGNKGIGIRTDAVNHYE